MGFRERLRRRTVKAMYEPPIVPPENPRQEKINRLYDMKEAALSMGSALDEYLPLFGEEITNFLADVWWKIGQEESDE